MLVFLYMIMSALHACQEYDEMDMEEICSGLTQVSITSETNYPLQEHVQSIVCSPPSSPQALKVTGDFLERFLYQSNLLDIMDKAGIPYCWMRQKTSYTNVTIPEALQFPNYRLWAGTLKIKLIGSELAYYIQTQRYQIITPDWLRSSEAFDYHMLQSKDTNFLEVMIMMRLIVKNTRLTPATIIQQKMSCPMQTWINYITSNHLIFETTGDLSQRPDYLGVEQSVFSYFVKACILHRDRILESELLHPTNSEISVAATKGKIIQSIAIHQTTQLLFPTTQKLLQKIHPTLLLYLIGYNAGFGPLYTNVPIQNLFCTQVHKVPEVEQDFAKNMWHPTRSALHYPIMERSANTFQIGFNVRQEWYPDFSIGAHHTASVILDRIEQRALELGIDISSAITALKPFAEKIYFKVNNSLDFLMFFHNDNLELYLPKKSNLNAESAPFIQVFFTEKVIYWTNGGPEALESYHSILGSIKTLAWKFRHPTA